MPYIRGDVEMFDEILGEVDEADLPPGFADKRPSGEFDYQPAAARFDPGKLGAVARVMLDTLRAAGATGLRVRYDGGYDEGFAHPDAVRFGDHPREVSQVLAEIASPALVAAVRAAAGRDSAWGNAAEMYAGVSDDVAVSYAMEELAHELASRLLGDGYGTGEYQLYGAFIAELESGQITDHPDARKPAEMD